MLRQVQAFGWPQTAQDFFVRASFQLAYAWLHLSRKLSFNQSDINALICHRKLLTKLGLANKGDIEANFTSRFIKWLHVDIKLLFKVVGASLN
ncbi:hypothetical protein BCU36_025425 [Vibrio lentus]|uniref:hypothetical protein n=1 Tax=Vibrio lentus TaxID=136468 RepID=UPI0039A72ED7